MFNHTILRAILVKFRSEEITYLHSAHNCEVLSIDINCVINCLSTKLKFMMDIYGRSSLEQARQYKFCERVCLFVCSPFVIMFVPK